MKLMLIFPPWTGVFGSMTRVAQGASTFPPLNLAYLAAIAERDGHVVRLIDGEAEQLSTEDIVDRVRSFAPDAIGLTATTPSFHLASGLARTLRAITVAPIIVGGPHVTFFRERIFEPWLDYLIIGQCENTFGLFLRALENGTGPDEIPGVLFRRQGKVVFTGENRQVLELDAVPFPARHLLRMELYNVGTLRGRKRYTSIMASRGCPFGCVFCSTSIYGKRVRFRTVDNVMAEMRQVIETTGISHFYFVDDVLTLNQKYILDFCRAIKTKRLAVTWEGSTRANLVSEDVVAAMAGAGLIRISFGLETADEDVRRIIKKGVPLHSYIDANKLTNKYGIETINSVMLGLPGDTRDSIRRTISFVRSARTIKHATFGIAMPYPGSEMYEMALRGDHGLRLETRDFARYQRYNSAVMTVNGIGPAAMMRLQKIGLLKIYLVPWRLFPILKRFGFISLLGPFFGALKSWLVPQRERR